MIINMVYFPPKIKSNGETQSQACKTKSIEKGPHISRVFRSIRAPEFSILLLGRLVPGGPSSSVNQIESAIHNKTPMYVYISTMKKVKNFSDERQ